MDNGGAYFACLLLTFLIGFSIELLSTLKVQNEFLSTGLFALRLFLSYITMMIVMTYNVGLLLAACFGLSTGYFLCGFGQVVIAPNSVKM